MIKSMIAAALLAAVASGAAVAETSVSSPEDCLKIAFDIAQAAEGKNLPNEKLDKVEELLTKMETYCDAKQFTEAAAVAGDLKTLISAE